MATRVGFIGLGDMGKAMASNLAPKGFDVRVYDLNPVPAKELAEAGATAASSCREVGEHAEVLSICVPADKHVEAVLVGEGCVVGVGVLPPGPIRCASCSQTAR